MNKDHAMAIVCDLALCIGREVTLDDLLTKVLQRFLFHCACPVGLVLQQLPQGEFRIIKAIGDEQLIQHDGHALSLPDWVSEGEQCTLHDIIPLPGSRPYRFAYRLKIEGGYLMLLLSPRTEQRGKQFCHLFSPILGNLARAIQLCRDSEQLALRQQAELVDMQCLNESLLKALPIPVFYKDVEGRFISCNSTFTQITGISKAELLGKRVDEILLEARILTVADIVESMSSDRPYRAALGIPQARDHIIQMRGAQLDEAVVDACLRILDRGDFTPHELGHGQP